MLPVEPVCGAGGLCIVGLKGLSSYNFSETAPGTNGSMDFESSDAKIAGGTKTRAEKENRNIPNRKIRRRRVEMDWLPAIRRPYSHRGIILGVVVSFGVREVNQPRILGGSAEHRDSGETIGTRSPSLQNDIR